MSDMGGISIQFPDSKTRRGRVIEDGKIVPTLDTGCQIGIVLIEEDENKDNH